MQENHERAVLLKNGCIHLIPETMNARFLADESIVRVELVMKKSKNGIKLDTDIAELLNPDNGGIVNCLSNVIKKGIRKLQELDSTAPNPS